MVDLRGYSEERRVKILRLEANDTIGLNVVLQVY